jgi:hypothetical protein
MKTTRNNIIKGLIASLILVGSLKSQSLKAQEQKAKWSIEVDPATFVFNGYSAHLRVQPKHSKHLLVGAGVYAMDLPDLIVNLNSNNKDQGWKSRIDLGYGLFAEHYFSEVNRKWFIGGQLSIQNFKLEKENTPGSSSYSNGLIMAYGGYSWAPFQFPLYLKFWAGLGYTSKISGENDLEGIEYDIAPLTSFATLHIGYTF